MPKSINNGHFTAWNQGAQGMPSSRLEPLLVGAASFPPEGQCSTSTTHASWPPGDMPARIAEACRAAVQVVPTDRVTVVRATQPLTRYGPSGAPVLLARAAVN